jgi:hypothetical protein
MGHGAAATALFKTDIDLTVSLKTSMILIYASFQDITGLIFFSSLLYMAVILSRRGLGVVGCIDGIQQ